MQTKNDDFLSQIVGYIIPTGALYDPLGKRGLSSVATDMFRFGSKKYADYSSLFAKLESIGGSLMNNSGFETSSLLVSVPSQNAAQAVELVDDLYHQVLDKADDLKKSINNEKLAIDNIMSNDLKATAAIFRNNLYGTPLAEGVKAELDTITVDDLKQFRKSLDTNKLFLNVKSLNNYDSKGTVDLTKLALYPKSDKSESVIFLEKEMVQKVAMLGFKTEGESSYYYYVRNVALAIVSGSWSSLAFDRIRERESAAYYAGAQHVLYDNFGHYAFYAGLSEEKIVKCTGLMLEILDDVQSGNFNKELLQYAKKTFISNIEQTFDSLEGITGYLGYRLTRKKPIATYEEIVERTNAVTLEQVTQFYRDLCKDKQLNLIVNGSISPENRSELTKLVSDWQSHD